MSRRLTLVIHSLEGGGAERTLAMMANHWAAQGDQVTFVTLASPQRDSYELSPAVHRVCLDGMQHSANAWEAVVNNWRRLIRLRRALRAARADVVISFTDKMNILTLLAGWGLRQRVVISERVDPRRHEIGRGWSLLRRWTYGWCDTLVVQTDGVRGFFRPFVRDSKIRVIPNAVTSLANPPSAPNAREPWVAAVGRLERQKGFDLLLAAFAQVAGKHPGWQLKILGDGSQRAALADQVRCLGLEQSVELCGWVSSPQARLQKSALFVCSSRYEGFPNALLEAMSAGTPAISFDCESGPSEIIRHEVDGLLVTAEDVHQLAQALDRLMSDAGLRTRFGERARDVAERFGQGRFFQRWEAILNAVPDHVVRKREI